MRYEICHSGGVQSFEALTVEDAVTEFDYRGYTLAPAPHSFNHNRHQRAELQGQPRFAALVGPMFGGTRNGLTIRYETNTVYDAMSGEG
jgi:hypothetical protein